MNDECCMQMLILISWCHMGYSESLKGLNEVYLESRGAKQIHVCLVNLNTL